MLLVATAPGASVCKHDCAESLFPVRDRSSITSRLLKSGLTAPALMFHSIRVEDCRFLAVMSVRGVDVRAVDEYLGTAPILLVM